MPSAFEQSGLHFEYPENWTLDAGSDDQVEQVVVSSPNTGFWHLSKYSQGAELEPLFDEALAALRAEYPGMETELSTESGQSVEGRPMLAYNVNFICLDLTNTCWLRGFETHDATYLLLCQAEDREFAQVAPVFQAMLASLLRHLS